MGGMFYTLEEVAEKLNKTKEEIKELVEQGALREFRDGPASYFKIAEVEAFASGGCGSAAPEAREAEEAAIPEAVEAVPDSPDTESSQPEEDLPPIEFNAEAVPSAESEDMGAEEFDAAAIDELVEGMPVAEAAPVAEVSEAKPKKKAKKQRFKAKAEPKVKRPVKQTTVRAVKRQRRTFGQWLLYGLTEDNPSAVFVLVLLFCAVISAFAALGYGLYFMYVNY